MRIFLKNTVKIASATRAEPLLTPACLRWLRFQTPALLLPPTTTTLPDSFLVLNAFYYPKKVQNNHSKSSAFAFSALLHLSVDFVERAARMFLASGRRYPSYATAYQCFEMS